MFLVQEAKDPVRKEYWLKSLKQTGFYTETLAAD
jgi:hypothetical protein